jgi:fused signal recognition particle receptor
MSFFSRLKDRLFKSSSKLSEGVDAIIADAPAAEAVAEAAAPAPAALPEAPHDPELATRADPEPEPDRTPEHEREPEPEPEATTAGPDRKPDSVNEPESEPERPGLIARILRRDTAPRRVLDDAMLESLEDLLISADMGVETAGKLVAELSEAHFGRRLTAAEVRGHLARGIAGILAPVARPMPLYPKTPQVILVAGVNGSGKTTTIGKLASQFRAAGKSVVIAACDTFRAAAVEQLRIWGDRAGVPVLTAAQGSDPASLAFEALSRAEAEGADLLMIDTAGRLQNRADLMEELAKIVRVLRKKDPDAPHNTILVLDATTGQNALTQVEIFGKIADVTGLVMTKLDGTAKGGVLVALADRFALPIHAIGVGEGIDDLQPFDPEDFARALAGA